MQNKIAGVVLCFNRADYLHPTLVSLENNVEVEDIDWFIFQDGGVNEYTGIEYADADTLKSVQDVIRDCSLPNLEVDINFYNLSPAQQRYRALQLLEDYETIFCFDDDMVVSKYYLKLLRLMSKQFPNYIGLLYNNKSGNPNRQLHLLREERLPRLWGHYLTRDSYYKFKGRYTEYYDYIKQGDFHQRRNWVVRTKKVPYIMDDIAVTRLAREAGVKKLVPYVSRGTYIGKFGMVAYKTEGYWKKKGMNRQPQVIEYEADATLKGFKKK